MNMLTTIKAAYEPTPFERKWRRMTDKERRSYLLGWFAPGSYLENLMREKAVIVEMALAAEGHRDRDMEDYRKIGTIPSYAWGE